MNGFHDDAEESYHSGIPSVELNLNIPLAGEPGRCAVVPVGIVNEPVSDEKEVAFDVIFDKGMLSLYDKFNIAYLCFI
jgi:hypothetical protein